MRSSDAVESWPLVRFAEVLKPNKRPQTLTADQDADLVGMRLYGEGPFFREHKAASKILKKTHFVIRTGDVIYNKLFAWKGTFGIVPEALDGMYVSDKFPTYQLDDKKVDPRFLSWYFRYPGLWEQARRMSTGSAALSKLTLNPPKFLDLMVKLPPLERQRDIASNLEKYSGMLTKARGLMTSVAPEAEALFLAALDKRFDTVRERYGSVLLTDTIDSARGISYGVVQTGVPFDGGVLTLRAGDLRPYEVLPSNVKRVDPSIESKYQRTRLEGREVLLRIRGGLGEVAVCPPEMVGGNVSREIAVIPVAGDWDSAFIMYAMATPSVQRFLRSNLRGTSYVGINLKDVRRVPIPKVPARQQPGIVAEMEALRKRVDLLGLLQENAATLTDALLPSLIDGLLGQGELSEDMRNVAR